MGAKGTKFLERKFKTTVDADKIECMTKEELVACLASVSHMAHTGVGTGLPEIRINDKPPDTAIKPESFKTQMRQRLQRQVSTNQEQALSEHAHKQLELLDDLESQDDNSDWASMRSWLVWCLQTNLDDGTKVDPSPPSTAAGSSRRQLRPPLNRQKPVDQESMRLVHQGSLSFESDTSGRFSGQNSFDSTGGIGES